MTIEAKLDRMIELLEAIASAKPAAAAAPAAPAPAAKPATPAAKPATKPAPARKSSTTLDDLKVVLKKVLDDSEHGGKTVAIEILQRFGAAKLGELAENQYDEVKECCENVLAGTHQSNGDPVAADDSELM